MDKGDVIKAIDALVEEAYQRGFAAGKKAITDSLMHLAETVTPDATNDSEPKTVVSETPRGTFEVEHFRPRHTPRAPRGLTEYVMRRVVSFYWMPVEEIQKKAVEADRRVSPKTVYNTLYRHPELFEKDENNRWRRRHSSQIEGGQEALPEMEANMSEA